ncbi:MAG: hypothetical protein ABEJ02_04040 [Candidatus Paceibacteria bacterium]
MKQNKYLFKILKTTGLKLLGEKIAKLNQKKREYKVSPETEKHLQEIFKEDAKKLQELISKDLTKHWTIYEQE